MRKRTLFCAGSLLTAAVAGVLVIQLASAPRVTEENYQTNDTGMGLSDVETLLGTPVGNRVAVLNYLFLCSSSGTLSEQYGLDVNDDALTWSDRGGLIIVGFRPDGSVSYKRYDPAVEESLLHMARRRLGL